MMTLETLISPVIAGAEDSGEFFTLHDALRDIRLRVLAETPIGLIERHVARIIKENPESVRSVDSRGYLPIHLACVEGASAKIIEMLVNAWPGSLLEPTKNKSKYIPLHLVCKMYRGNYADKTKVLTYILHEVPNTVGIAAGNGSLPLHLYLQNYFCNIQDLKLLVGMLPDSLEKRDKHGRLPLHLACERHYMERLGSKSPRRRSLVPEIKGSTSQEVIDFLAQRFPDALRTKNDKGELPLHAALRAMQKRRTIQLLVDGFSESITLVNGDGRDAISIARSHSSRFSDEATVRFLKSALQQHDYSSDTEGENRQTQSGTKAKPATTI